MAIIKETAEIPSKKVKILKAKPKLKVWTEDKGKALKEVRSVFMSGPHMENIKN